MVNSDTNYLLLIYDFSLTSVAISCKVYSVKDSECPTSQKHWVDNAQGRQASYVTY